MCTMVTHHLSGSSLAQLVAESARVLKSGGKLILADAVWTPTRWTGRILWKYDRGSYPRTAEALRTAISEDYTITHWERFAVYHEYVLFEAAKGGAES